MSGPRGVRRRDKGEREAVFFFWGGGGNLSRAEVRLRRISRGRTPQVGLEGEKGRPDRRGRGEPGRGEWRKGGAGVGEMRLGGAGARFGKRRGQLGSPPPARARASR